MKKTCFVVMVFGALLLCVYADTAFGIECSADPEDRRISIAVSNEPFGNVLEMLMTLYDLQFGFEESVLDRGRSELQFSTNPGVGRGSLRSINGGPTLDIEVRREFRVGIYPITVELENAKICDVIDRIVEQIKNYDWEMSDGVVNIFPKKGRDRRFAELLQTKVRQFEIDKGKTIKDITHRLHGTIVMRDWLNRNNLAFNPVRPGSSFLIEAQYGRKIEETISFSDITFKSLLNRIVRNKKGGWIIRWKGMSPEGEEHIDLDI